MRNLLIILLLGLMYSCSKVPAGHVGVKVYLLGGDKGVDSEELGVGRYWIGINEELYLFPTFQQNYVWTADERDGSENDESFTFQTKEGMQVGADVGITYSLDPKKISTIFSKYRRGVDEITDTFLRNYVRDAFNAHASTMAVESVYGEGKAKLLSEVEESVRTQVASIGINVEKIYLVNTFRLPETVTEALNRKIEATQRAEQRENELREAEAQAKKNVAEAEGKAKVQVAMAEAEGTSILIKAKAEAEANSVISKSLDSKLIQYERVKRWDGVMPKVVGGENTSLLIDTK